MTFCYCTKPVLMLGIALASLHSSAYSVDVTGKSKELLLNKQAKEAYILLSSVQSEHAGESDYDYLLAISALDSGKPTEAVFALERFLATNPGHGPARLELARAYYLLGETTASRLEFETVKRQQPPDQVNQAIQAYLSSINQIASTQGTSIRGYIEILGGHDSNANSGIAARQIAVPLFGGELGELSSEARRRSDKFFSMASGVSARHAVSAEWTINANLNIGQRYHEDYSEYDLGYADTSLGLTLTQGIDQFSGALQYQKIMVDRDSYRDSFGITGQWQRTLDEGKQLTAYTQISRLDYAGQQTVRDADRYVLGGAYSQAFEGIYSPVVYAGLYVGKENSYRSDLPYLDNQFVGVRFGGQMLLTPRLKINSNLSVEKRRYDGEEILFMERRQDRQTDISVSLNYSPALFWTLRPEFAFTRNRSDIVLNDYVRRQYLITVRRDFN